MTDGSNEEKNENGDRMVDTQANLSFSAISGAAYTSSPAINRSGEALLAPERNLWSRSGL
jgi:hypothetical protein